MTLDSWQAPNGGSRQVDGDCYDLVRAIVSAFSWRDQSTLVPVSTLSVQHELKRRNQEIHVSDVLDQLSEVRDVQRVEGGYWLPSPTHIVTSPDFALVISGSPTQELQREMSLKPVNAGVSRIVDANQARLSDLPVRSLVAWMGAPGSTQQWTENLLRSVRYIAPFGLETAEVFRHWQASSRTRWERLRDIAAPNDCVVLARIRPARYRANYYLLRLRNGVPVAMHELPPGSDDVLRLMHGLQCIGGDPVKCRITRTRNANVAQVRAGVVPRAERRLLMALGQVVDNEQYGGVDVLLPVVALPSVLAVFELLGCEIEQVTS